MNKRDLLSVLPGPGTPGFDLATPRAFQVWLALLHRSQEIGSGGGEGHWALEELAEKCGVNVNTVCTALGELAALKWVKKSQPRHVSGQYGGFLFQVNEPPMRLTKTARALYKKKILMAKERLEKKEMKLLLSERDELKKDIKEVNDRAGRLIEEVERRSQKNVIG